MLKQKNYVKLLLFRTRWLGCKYTWCLNNLIWYSAAVPSLHSCNVSLTNCPLGVIGLLKETQARDRWKSHNEIVITQFCKVADPKSHQLETSSLVFPVYRLRVYKHSYDISITERCSNPIPSNHPIHPLIAFEESRVVDHKYTTRKQVEF